MKKAISRLLGAALGAAASFCTAQAPGTPPPLAEVRYEAGCVPVNETTVEGFVTNRTAGTLQVAGVVRFSFTLANSMSRPMVQTPVSVLIPPGQTMSVGRAQLAGAILPSETCQVDVTGAVR